MSESVAAVAHVPRSSSLWRKRARVGGHVVLAAVGLASAIVVLGWSLRSRALLTAVPSAVPMMFDASVAFVSLALASVTGAAGHRHVAQIGGGFAAIVGLASLVENVADVSLRIDQLFRHDWLPASSGAPGRLAPQVAIGLLVLGAAQVLPRRNALARDVLVALGAITGYLGLLAHLLGISGLVVVGNTDPMPTESAVLLVLVAIGDALLLAPTQSGFAWFFADSPRGALLRRVLGLAIAVPLVAGMLFHAISAAGVGRVPTISAGVSGVAIAVVVGVLWRAAAAADRVTGERDQATIRYRQLVESIWDGVFETRLDGGIVTASDSLAHLLGYPDERAFVASVADITTVWADPEDRADLVEEIRGGRHRGVREISIRRPDGSTFAAGLSYSAVLDDGVPVGLRGTLRDMTSELETAELAVNAMTRFTLAFHSGPLGRVIADLSEGQPRFVDVNDALLELLGVDRDDFLATDPLAFVHPDDEELEETQLLACISGAQASSSYDTRRRHRDGTWIPVRLAGAVARNGRKQYALATIEDLRPRLQLLEGLKVASEKSERSAAISAAVGRLTTSAFAANTEGRDVTAEGLELLADLLGCDLVLLYGSDEGRPGDKLPLVSEHGADRRLLATAEQFTDAIPLGAGERQTTIAESSPTRTSSRLPPLAAAQHMASAVAVASSSESPTSQVLFACMREARDWTGQEIGLVESVADLISLARRSAQTQRELARHVQLLRDLTEDAPAAIYLLDLDGRFLVVNREAEQVLGCARSEVLGRTREEIGDFPSEKAEHRAHDLAVIEAGRPMRFEEHATASDGRKRSFLSVRFPLRDGHDRIYGVGGISTDVTELRRVERESERAWTTALIRIARAVDYRDEETGGHIDRMAGYCEAIALRMGLGAEYATRLRQAAPLHDAGKLAVPDRILRKPGRLTPEEFTVMKTHTEVGHALLTGTGNPALELAAAIAYTHHERLDGSGYPRALEAGDIPLEGRIAAVADVFDALTSDRVYRPAWTRRKAVDHLLSHRGVLFDRDVVDALAAHLNEGQVRRDLTAAGRERVEVGSV